MEHTDVIKASSVQAFTEAKQRPPRRVCTRSSESRPTRRQRRSSRRTGAWPSNTTQMRRGRSLTIGFHPDFGQAIPPRRVAVGVRRPDFIQIHNAYATLSDPAARDFTQIHNTTLSDPATRDFTQIHNATLSKFTRRWVSNRRVIPNWDDIVDLCGKDRATGEGAETGVEAFEIMTPPHIETNHIDLDGDTQGLDDIEIINDISPTSANGQKTQSKRMPTNFVDVPHTKKKLTTLKDMIADSLAKMASSFQDYICADTKKLDPTEVYDEVNAIPDLNEEEQIKACAWLIENDKQFLMLKTLPVEKKKNMTHHIVAAINCWNIYFDYIVLVNANTLILDMLVICLIAVIDSLARMFT
ncbi:hypothetical protein C1H46_025434 [Malus baccata]|uniref:Uncharacterized protein n=1 Tax=Malus baccata TaxID=106549 RepID=A0A540LRC3_MALBA|nr:hypothetical protein C1H46_025434 [Malus baccata]